jgi:hypothetical protein
MVSFLLAQPSSDDEATARSRYVYIGPLSRVQEFAERFNVEIWTGLGMTELSTALRSELNPTSEPTCGRPGPRMPTRRRARPPRP